MKAAKIKKLPSARYLHARLIYNQLTGVLIWKFRPRRWFVSQRAFKCWNKRFAGKAAFSQIGSQGYLCGRLDSITYQAHRVVWKMMTGKEPPALIDHKDRNRARNSWLNLRAAELGPNRINSRITSGVHKLKNGTGWQAYIGVNRKLLHLGTFKTMRAAKHARIQAVTNFYGEFAPCA